MAHTPPQLSSQSEFSLTSFQRCPSADLLVLSFPCCTPSLFINPSPHWASYSFLASTPTLKPTTSPLLCNPLFLFLLAACLEIRGDANEAWKKEIIVKRISTGGTVFQEFTSFEDGCFVKNGSFWWKCSNMSIYKLAGSRCYKTESLTLSQLYSFVLKTVTSRDADFRHFFHDHTQLKTRLNTQLSASFQH